MDECGYALQQQTPLPFFDEPVSISIKIGRPDKRRRDLDNFATKAVFDALVHYRILDDDSLVHRFTAEWDEGITGIQVEIEEILWRKRRKLFWNGARQLNDFTMDLFRAGTETTK